MPIPPPIPLAPFDSVTTVLNLARVRMNDAAASLAGDVLTNAQPFTQAMVNSAWRKLQAFLANMGHSAFKKPIVMLSFPPVADLDPASQAQLTWTFYFDGTSYWIPPDVMLLPQDMILPLRFWERMTNSYAGFIPMEMAVDALPDVRKGGLNRWWLWENNTVYMPGALYRIDLRMEYAAFLGDFVTVGATPWYQQPVPLMRCLDAFACYLCAEADTPRGDQGEGLSPSWTAMGEEAARLMFNQEVSQRQRRAVSRKPYSNRGAFYGHNSQY